MIDLVANAQRVGMTSVVYHFPRGMDIDDVADMYAYARRLFPTYFVRVYDGYMMIAWG